MRAETTVLRSGSARLHVRAIGVGRPIVVLHGGPDFNHDYLLPGLDRLADLGRLVYYDQRGRGRSYSGETPDDVSLESEMDDLDRIREWTGSSSVALLGHSWGGLLALEYVSRYPERVSHLGLLNTAPVSCDDYRAMRQHVANARGPERMARMRNIVSQPAYLAGDIAADADFHRLHFAGALRRPEHLEQLVHQLRVGFTPEAIVAARAIEQRLDEETLLRDGYDVVPRLRRLRTPTLVLHGDHDLIPLHIARRVADAIPTAHLVVVADCGHFPYLEQPDAFHAAIAQLLSQHPAGAP